MINANIINELSKKIASLLSNAPISENNALSSIEKNINALLQGAFTKMELVSREEYDVQTAVLKKTRDKLAALEKKLESLEDSINK